MAKKVIKDYLIDVMGTNAYYGAEGLIAGTVKSAIEDVFAEEDDIDSAVDYETTRALTYNDDIWELLKYYQNPTEVNYDDMEEAFYEDVHGFVSDYIDQFGVEEDEDEE